MKISSLSRNTRARKPSHFGSKIHAPVLGNSLTRFASIGKIGGFTGSCILEVRRVLLGDKDEWFPSAGNRDRMRYHLLRARGRRALLKCFKGRKVKLGYPVKRRFTPVRRCYHLRRNKLRNS